MSASFDLEKAQRLRGWYPGGLTWVREGIEALFAEVERLQTENERLRAAQTWRPIETAPKGEDVLVVVRKQVHVGRFETDSNPDVEGWYFAASIDTNDDWPDPMHWMPLPLAPEVPK